MFIVLFSCICFFASVIGAICGIGGGIIIKPVLDSIGFMDANEINFLSGCTVLSMTSYSVLRNKRVNASNLQIKTGFPLAVGAAIGGILGKQIFTIILSSGSDKNKISALQAVCLLFITIGTLIYTLNMEQIRSFHISNTFFCLIIGSFLGIISSFLGIGGGPLNLVVLFYFFSMDTKTAAKNSLYIIFFSQTASLLFSVITKQVPDFIFNMLLLMIFCGISGGILGRYINKKLPVKVVDKLLKGLMVVIICINIYNIYQFI